MPDQQQVVINNSMRPPKFDGVHDKDANIHWLLFTDYIAEANIAEAQRVNKFRITLTGEPRQWFEDNKASFTTFDQLEQLFKAEYGPQVSRAGYIKQLQNITMLPNETVIDFKKRVFRTACKASLQDDGEMVITAFVGGLPQNIRDHVRSKRDANLDEALKTAQALMLDVPQVAPEATAYSVRDMTKRSDKCKITDLDMDVLTGKVQQLMYNDRKQGQHPISRNRSDSRGRGYQKPYYDRRMSGSNSRSNSRGRQERRGRDPTPRRERRNDSNGSQNRKVAFKSKSRSPSPGACYYCGKNGHIADSCRVLRKHLREGKIKMQNFQ